ncbi:MAG: M43 family zinc metalloprotease [Candidatus Delongbacteria bacterium]|jgi:PKD repeat protein|nr:M43 family zinc metalloprotease [Candidatus Delongbacteria bacterium]
MKYKICIFIITCLLSANVFAQNGFRCSTPEMNRIELENNPEARARRAALQEFIDHYTETAQDKNDIYIIPVVFHVVHNYGSENISYDQVADAVRILNEDYRKMNPDTSFIIDEFKSLATDARVEFRLAALDPSGNCTNGVTRTVSPLTLNGGEQVKDVAPGWPRASYLNIWVVRSIGGGVAGYSYYPGTVQDGRDGIVIMHTYIGSVGTGQDKHTLTHEVGHWLNLAHPWGSTNDPEVASNCDMDDGIADTPNTIGHASCNLYAVTCGSLDNVQNYMEYSFCSRMFTHEQGEMMRTVLNSSVSDRDNLSTEANLIATGTLNPDEAAICLGNAEFSYDVSHGCEGLSVQFTDMTFGTDSITSYNWTFEGGTPAVSHERHPQVVYQSAGYYDVELEVVNPAGNDISTKTGLIRVYPSSAGNSLPVVDGFESTEFPDGQNPADDYYFITPGVNGFSRTSEVAYEGGYSMSIDLKNEVENVKNAFVIPAAKCDSTDFPLQVNFDVAYAQSDENSIDILKVFVSNDCGENWLIRYYKSGNTLATTDDYYPSGTFTPTIDEWHTESFEIYESWFGDAGSVRLKFEAESKGGNALYIDNINITSLTTVSQNHNANFNVYPTSFKDRLILQSDIHSEVVLSIYDVCGRMLVSSTVDLNKTQNIAGYIPGDHTGMVIIKIKTPTNVAIFRAIAVD